MLGGHPADLRRHASSLRRWADSVADQSVALRQGEQVEWRSTAGDAFRGLIEADVGLLDRVSHQIRDAARAFDHLADTLQERQHWIEHPLGGPR